MLWMRSRTPMRVVSSFSCPATISNSWARVELGSRLEGGSGIWNCPACKPRGSQPMNLQRGGGEISHRYSLLVTREERYLEGGGAFGQVC